MIWEWLELWFCVSFWDVMTCSISVHMLKKWKSKSKFKFDFCLSNKLLNKALCSYPIKPMSIWIFNSFHALNLLRLTYTHHLIRSQHEKWKVLIRVEYSQWPLAGQKNTIHELLYRKLIKGLLWFEMWVGFFFLDITYDMYAIISNQK